MSSRFKTRRIEVAAALLEQALYAGSSFVSQIYVARQNAADVFGAFSVATAVFFLAALAHQTFLVEPAYVFSSGRYREKMHAYHAEIFGKWSICVGLGICAFFSTAGICALSYGSNELGLALLAYAFSAPLLLHLWLARRLMVLRGNGLIALKAIALYALSLFSMLAAAYLADAHSPTVVILGMGGSAALSAIIFNRRLLKEIRGDGLEAPAEMILQHVRYGRWSFLTEMIIWSIANLPLIVMPMIFSFAASSALRVVSLIFMPLQQVVSVASMFMLRRFAGNGNAGPSKNEIFIANSLLFLASTIYTACAYIFAPYMHIFFGESYVIEKRWVAIGGVGVIFFIALQASVSVLRVRELSRVVLFLHGVALLLMSAAASLLYKYGVDGVLIAQAITWSLVCAQGVLVVVRLNLRSKAIS